MMWFSKVFTNNQRIKINFGNRKSINKTNNLTSIKYPKLLLVESFSNKGNSLLVKRLNNKLILVFLLNVSDLLFTWLFVVKHPSLFIEVNPFAKEVINNLPLSLCLKLSIVLIVLAYFKYKIKSSTSKSLSIIKTTIILIIIFYTAVNIIHLFNLIFLLTY